MQPISLISLIKIQKYIFCFKKYINARLKGIKEEGIHLIEFKLAKKGDIKKITSFIAKINCKEENHIGYCGINSEEIANLLIEDIFQRKINGILQLKCGVR